MIFITKMKIEYVQNKLFGVIYLSLILIEKLGGFKRVLEYPTPRHWFVCVYVIRNKKSTGPIWKICFSCKGMDPQSNMGYITSFADNAELQETPKTVKKSSKTGFSDFHDCIAKSSCSISTKIGSMV